MDVISKPPKSIGNFFNNKKVQELLSELHLLSDRKDPEVLRSLMRSGYDWWSASAKHSAMMFREAPLAVTKDAGVFLYILVRAMRPRTVVEFGTSYGVSSIYIAAALKDNGFGRLITTEIDTEKAAIACSYMDALDLSDIVDIRVGDARDALQEIDVDVDFFFLDGWKNLYLELLNIVERKLRPGSVVLADDLDANPKVIAPYLNYVKDISNGYVSVTLPVSEGRELSIKVF